MDYTMEYGLDMDGTNLLNDYRSHTSEPDSGLHVLADEASHRGGGLLESLLDRMRINPDRPSEIEVPSEEDYTGRPVYNMDREPEHIYMDRDMETVSRDHGPERIFDDSSSVHGLEESYTTAADDYYAD